MKILFLNPKGHAIWSMMLASVWLLSTGCATPMVAGWGREGEILLSCDRAFQHDNNVLIEYTVAWNEGQRTAKRWALVQLDPNFDPTHPTIDVYPRTKTERHDGLIPTNLANDAIPMPIIEMDHRPRRNEKPSPDITPSVIVVSQPLSQPIVRADSKGRVDQRYDVGDLLGERRDPRAYPFVVVMTPPALAVDAVTAVLVVVSAPIWYPVLYPLIHENW
jgi:hypothetical protein